MTDALAGRVVALIGAGTEAGRVFVVACAEAGANIALGTVDTSQAQEFAMNSIANEIWSIGREHFVRVMDHTDPTAVVAFADEIWDRFGRCDLAVLTHDVPSFAPIEELSPDEWDATIQLNLTAPFLAAQAIGRLMEREGGGHILILIPDDTANDAAYRAARAGLRVAGHVLNAALLPRGVTVGSSPNLPVGAAALAQVPR